MPAGGDFSSGSNPIELGVRFRSDVAGQVTAVRFYKASINTGAHIGHLWTSSGTLLGSVTFSGETATGWQTMNFASPIPIQSSVTYVASYHLLKGYAVTRNAFAAAGVDHPPLHALKDNVAAPDGAYAYSSAAVFPTHGTLSSNFWVDIVFSVPSSTNPVPAVASISPSSRTAGGAAFTLLVNGSGFVSTSTVRWNGGLRPTTFLSTSALTAQIAAGDIASPSTALVTVFNAGPGGGLSNASTFTVTAAPNPVPSIAAIAPSSATAGGAAFTLLVNGSGYVSTSTVRWNGSLRPTTFLSAGALSAQIAAGDIASTGTALVTVFNAGPGGGLSNASTFTVTAVPNPVPAVAAINPSTAAAGGAAFTLQVLGSGFISTSTVLWRGAGRPTTFIDSGTLTAQIAAGDLASTGTVQVTVFNAGPGGGLSNASTFTITAVPNPVPAIAAIAPSSATAGGAGFTLQVFGSGFVSTSTVLWSGAGRPTTFVDSGTLSAQIAAGDIASSGTVSVTVFNAGPGGGLSNASSFTIVNPAPVLATLAPSSATVGGAGFTLRVFGSGFVSTSTVLWSGAGRPTTFVDTGTLTALIAAGDLASTGTVLVTVFNAGPGGGLSNASSFTIGEPVPALAALAPSSATVGGTDFTLQVFGSGFISTSTILWSGAARTTIFIDSGTLSAQIAAGDIASTGTALVTVFNAGPGGGLSNASTFTITGAPNPAPAIAAIAPSSATAGGAGFTLQVFGSGFVSTSTVLWSGAGRPTTFVDTGTLTAQIAAGDIASTGTVLVTVFDAGPGGGLSNVSSFTIVNPVPAVAALAPSSAAAGGAAFTLQVLGSGFVSTSTALWNGAGRATTFISTGTLSVLISSGDIISTGTALVTVFNPGPGGGLSNVSSFTVVATTGAHVWTAGFYAGWTTEHMTIQQVDFGAVDAVLHFAVKPNADGSLDTAADTISSAAAAAVVAATHGAGKKVLYSVGGWLTQSGFEGAMSSAHSATFVNNLVNFMTNNGYDGIDIDMEPMSASDAAPYAAFIQALRARMDAVHPGALLTADVIWDPAVFGQLAAVFDHINIMTYVLGGTWLHETWHNAPIFSAGTTLPSADSLVKQFEAAGVPAARLGIGICFDGFIWTGGSGVTGPRQTWTSAPTATEVAYYQIADTYGLAEGSTSSPLYRFDAAALAPYLSVTSTTASGDAFVSFDDTFLIQDKYQYARTQALGSMIIWNLASGFRSNLSAGQQDLLLQSVKSAAFGPPTLAPASAFSVAARSAASPGPPPMLAFDFPTLGPNADPASLGAVAPPSPPPPAAPAPAAASDLDSVRVYPNPWRSNLHAGLGVTLDGLTPQSRIRIYTVSGQWVRTLDAAGGVGRWDLTNDSGQRVGSGVYLYIIADPYGRRRSGILAVVR